MLHDARARRPSAGNRIDLIGLPTDAGASCRGAALGPDDLRTAGLAERLAGLGYAVADLGDVNVGNKLAPAAEIEALAIGASEACPNDSSPLKIHMAPVRWKNCRCARVSCSRHSCMARAAMVV